MKVGDLGNEDELIVSLNRTGSQMVGWYSDNQGDCASKEIAEIPNGLTVYASRKDCLCGEYGWC